MPDQEKLKDPTPQWSDEKLEKEEQSKKEKEQKLKPGEEEAYLLLIALLLIASGPVGIAIAAGLVGGYGAIKAADLKRYADKAKKIKKQKKLREQNYKDVNVIENEKQDTKIKEQEQVDKSVAQNSLKTRTPKEIETLSDCYETENDLIETLSKLDVETLDHISKMPEKEIEATGESLAEDRDSRKIFEQLLDLKKDLGSKTREQNIVEPENELEGKNLKDKLNRLINTSNQPNNVLVPSGPSPVELKTIDDSLQKENSEKTNQEEKKTEMTQDTGSLVKKVKTQKNIERHNIRFPLQNNPTNHLNQKGKAEKNPATNIRNNPFDQFLKPQIGLTNAGDNFRAKEQTKKLSNAKKEKKQTTIQPRKSK